ncbi:iron ABC transporter permease [Spongiactinospora sp. TRM90649]|uniref:ABC transporter permease n=1 Tax=Spongiactinospora sp. TRM90649 TaxID=3031114 RepID=UPI0023F82972|nr:iron ABC transporter permease [Spongiactinospora sp. TRM90649]MDF5756940.1 iron ABC transporter permease [Spongiactinospora sp. TRM90649]
MAVGRRVLIYALVAGVFVLCVSPVVMLVVGAFRTSPPGLPGEWSLEPFAEAYGDPVTYTTLRNSAILAVSTKLISTALAVFFCWVVARTTTPLRRLVTPMMLFVFAMPTLFFALSWGMLGNPDVGLLNKPFEAMFGAHPININSWWGLIFVTALKSTASSYILLLGPFLALDRSLEEASFVSGAGRLRTFLRVDLPVLAPAITGIMILGFVIGLGSLDAALIIGVPAGIMVFPTQLFGYLYNSATPEYAQASALALLLVLITVVLVRLQGRLLGNRRFTTVTGKGYRQEPWDIGRWRYVCTGGIVLYGLFGLVLPLSQLVLGSLQPVFGLYGALTLDNYRELFDQPDIVAAFQATIVIALLGGLLAMLLAVSLQYLIRHHPSRITRLISMATWLPWALPGIVLGLAMSWAYLSLPGLRELYGTVWILMIALIVTVTPIAGRVAEGAVVQLGRELEESARTSGASSMRALVGIVGRLILPSFVSGWFVTAIVISGSFDVPILMSTSTNRTIPVVVYELYTLGQTPMAAAVFCLLLGGVGVVYVAGLALRRVVSGRRPKSGNSPAVRPAGAESPVMSVR